MSHENMPSGPDPEVGFFAAPPQDERSILSNFCVRMATRFGLPELVDYIQDPRRLIDDPATAQLYGNETGFRKAFDAATANPTPESAKHISCGLVEAHNFSTTTLDIAPAQMVFTTTNNLAALEWQQHTWDVLGSSDTPTEYKENLWGSEPIHRRLEAVGRTRETIEEEQQREIRLFGYDKHFLANQERYDSVRAMVSGEHPDQKLIVPLAFDITVVGFQEWIKKEIAGRGKFTYANLSDIGDKGFHHLIQMLQVLPVVDNCRFVHSTRVNYMNDFMGTFRDEGLPRSQYSVGKQQIITSLARGATAYPFFI